MTLRIEVHKQNPPPQRGQLGGEVYRYGGLAGAAFAVGNDDGYWHCLSLETVQ